MKRLITISLLLFCFNSICIGACPEQIKIFYTTYLDNVLHDDSKNAVLCKTYLTEELIDRVDRLKNATGGDPIIRAQDANKDAIETLSVEDLADNWYLVKYFWKKGDNSSLIEIPLKAHEINGHCKITYITPIWNGSQYGDELLNYRDGEVNTIDQTSELSFLKSFYDAYISEYCDMPKNLNSRLYSLRLDHLSQNALEQFKNAELECLGDGLSGYDMLIDNFDFDCSWGNSIEFKHLSGNNYQITYKVGDKVYKIVATIKSKDNNYLIDGLSF